MIHPVTFAMLPLYLAIADVYETTPKAGASEWEGAAAIDVWSKVARVYLAAAGPETTFPYTIEEVRREWVRLRKARGGARKRQRLWAIVEAARERGLKCFWRGKRSGKCSDEAAIDLVLGEGGEEIEVVACTRHAMSDEPAYEDEEEVVR